LATPSKYTIRARQRLDKYQIVRKLADGGFARVYEAYDTIEGIYVALKIPHPEVLHHMAIEDFRKEVRLTAWLEHPNVLAIKNAQFIGDIFVIVYPLGDESLADRLTRRIATRTVLTYAEQLLGGLAFAHQHHIIHCDVKPENCILFPDEKLRLADFGIAKVALKTLSAAGTGTVGYLAPEQAMGKPSFRSDVFSAGLIIYEMLAGVRPEWPYEWPLPGLERLRLKVPQEMITFLRRSIEVNDRKRFEDAETMLAAFERLRSTIARFQARKKNPTKRKTKNGRGWQDVRRRAFLRQYRKSLMLNASCGRCGNPTSETMKNCPWCGYGPKVYRRPTAFPSRCRRCGRGMKLDWRFCPWCFGAGCEPRSEREFSDVRYNGRCSNPACSRKDLMPFMRYCPWCRTKVKRRWRIEGSNSKCPKCSWGVLPEYWDHCPWCAKRLKK